MKTKILTGFLCLLAVAVGTTAWSQQQADAASANALALGGAVSTDDRVSAQADPQLTFEAYRLELNADARPTDATRFHAEAWVRSAGLAPSSLSSTASLFSSGGTAPVSLDLREAWFEAKDLLISGLDLKVGRQRIPWGTADALSVVDNVNPLDLSDPWDFGRHGGSDGAQLNAYLGGAQLTALIVGQFAPAVLPGGQWANALMPSALQAPPGLTLATVSSSVTLPGASLTDSLSAGMRVKGNLLGYDLSISYLYGRQGLPVIDNIVLTSPGLPVVNAALNLVYPREHIFGADMAGSIFGVGVWAETAVFVPAPVTESMDSTALGGGVVQSVALSGSPYVKYVVGADYTFPGDLYLSGQFVHGLFQEASADNLHDYFSLALQWRLFDGKLTLAPLNAIVEVADWSNVADNYAVMASPSVTIHPLDNAELVVGFHWIQAASSTAFHALSGQDEVYAHARFSF